jgi:hypothetical protein
MLRLLNSCRLAGDGGTVTAELALALPSVALVIAITLSGFGLQIERMKLVGVAAAAARGLGRGEEQTAIRDLVSQAAIGADLRVEFLENYVCALVAKKLSIAGLPEFEVEERQCARKMGL